jgi:hypothetical protein
MVVKPETLRSRPSPLLAHGAGTLLAHGAAA